MSQFPPFPPLGRYSPSRSYGDQPSFAQQQSQTSPPYSPFTYPPASGPPPPSFRPYDAYGSEPPRHNFAYEQPRRPYDSELYDPYQPANTTAYDPTSSNLRLTAPAYNAPEPTRLPPKNSSMLNRSPPRSTAPPPRFESKGDVHELSLLTGATTVNISGHTIAVHSLSPSHLPIDKYVAMNRDDALEVHRQLCSGAAAIWYADGSSRAGEGWSAAVEWIIDSGRSGSKMRGFVGNGDALDAELGGICKAAEGFQELLHQSIKDGKPMSHDLIVFCDSPAAIVSVDTSSRPEALRFDRLWRDICSEFLQARMKLAWLPKGTNIEGHILADKIATVGASNSYLKRKKENTLSDIYRRPGGGDPAPGGSTEAGPWQRGDADPSRRKTPFERPKPLPSPQVPLLPEHIASPYDYPPTHLPAHAAATTTQFEAEGEDDSGQPREGSIFVTHFPEEASAKDLGILFAQYGNIVAVDIYHISPNHPRFAFVAYTDPQSGQAAIDALHNKPIELNNGFATENHDDLDVWRKWPGPLTVVMSEPPRLVPISVAADFPDLPDWASGGGTKDAAGDDKDKVSHDATKQDRESSLDSSNRKRDRRGASIARDNSASPSIPDSPPPRKRARPNLHAEAHNDNPQDSSTDRVNSPLPVKKEPGIMANDQPNVKPDQEASGNDGVVLPHLMPPFPPTLKGDAPSKAANSPQNTPITRPEADSQLQMQGRSVSTLPPTPNTAERPLPSNGRLRSPPRQLSLEPGTLSSKRPLTNSASEPQEHPIVVGVKTLRALIDLVRRSFGKVDVNNWIAHACFIASDLNEARRALQDDLYATDTAFLTGRDLERELASRNVTPQRVDAFITKVLNVLDGIALAEQEEDANANDASIEVEDVQKELDEALAPYPNQTKEAVSSASTLLEYLMRGKEAQDRHRLQLERRVKVLEGMVKIGEVVGGVVRFLLSEDKS